MFDCKRVIYARRLCSIKEGEKLVVMNGEQGIATGPICTELHFHPPEGEADKLHVIAYFEDKPMKIILDIDEVEGKEV